MHESTDTRFYCSFWSSFGTMSTRWVFAVTEVAERAKFVAHLLKPAFAHYQTWSQDAVTAGRIFMSEQPITEGR